MSEGGMVGGSSGEGRKRPRSEERPGDAECGSSTGGVSGGGEDENDRKRFIAEYSRLDHHQETDMDSEHPPGDPNNPAGPNDPEWLRIKQIALIDEFVDITDAEKEFVKMWNLFMMKYNYVGDCQIPFACIHFVDLHWREVIRGSLAKEFHLHIINLFDFGLLTTSQVVDSIKHLQSKAKFINRP